MVAVSSSNSNVIKVTSIIPRISPRKPTPQLAKQPAGRFEFTFALKHGSCQNIVESLTYSILRHIRVMSKQKLKDRVIDGNGQRASGGSHLVP